MPPLRYAATVALSGLLLACPSEKVAETAPDAGPVVWSDAREKTVATLEVAPGKQVGLMLSYAPPGKDGSATVELKLQSAEGARPLWMAAPDPVRRDVLWSADWKLSSEPSGDRLALSSDGGTTWRPVLKGPEGGLFFCPHVKLPSEQGAVPWSKLPGLAEWAADVMETAVWGCDEQGRGCRARSLVGRVVHHSEPGEDPLGLSHGLEMQLALWTAERITPDRRLAVALVDASLGYQRGFSSDELKRLGGLAGKQLAAPGVLSPEEQRALQLRATLAREELKKGPGGQRSPRESIEALFAVLTDPPKALEGVPVRDSKEAP